MLDAAEANMPYLKPWWRITYEATRVTFHYGEQIVTCNGRTAVVLLPALIPLLDGRHTVAQIVERIGAAAETAIRKTLDVLAARELLVEGPAVADAVPQATRDAVHFIAANHRITRSLNEDASALLGLRVGVIGSAGTAREIVRSLSALGATAHTLAWQAPEELTAACDMVVVAPSAQELPFLADWNRRAVRSRTQWLQVLPHDGKFAAVGPLYVPGETCCYECFAYRRASNVGYPAEYWAMQSTPAPYPSPLPLDLMITGLATMAVLRWHLRADDGLPGQYQAIEFCGDITLSTHLVYRVPRCKACSSIGTVASPLPWYEAS